MRDTPEILQKAADLLERAADIEIAKDNLKMMKEAYSLDLKNFKKLRSKSKGSSSLDKFEDDEKAKGGKKKKKN